MGRHATAAPVDASLPNGAVTGSVVLPITDPALLDRARPSSPEAPIIRIAPTVEPEHTRDREHTDVVLPAPVSALRHGGRPAVLPTTPRRATGGTRRLTATSLLTGPVSIIGGPQLGPVGATDRAPSYRRGTSLALCAVAVLGAVSAGALLLPTARSSAEAAELASTTGPICKADPGSVPMPGRRALALRHRIHRSHPVLAPAAVRASEPSATASTSSTPSPTTPRTTAPTSATPSTSTPSVPTWSPSSTIRSLRDILASAVSGRVVALAAGTFTWSNFGSNLIGLDAGSSVKGFQGAGIDKTVLEMTPHTSDKAGSVPTALGTTNQLSLMRVSGSPILSDFTLQGTDQGHLYNGLRVAQATDARVSDIRIIGAPGNFDSPPGETFGLNDWRTTGSVYDGIEVDGDGVGAAGFAANSSTDITVNNSYFHDNAYSHGATFWQTKNITINNTRSVDNKDTGFNFERVTGTVTMNHVTTAGNQLADIRIGNDQGSATYRIVDPVYSGSKLRIMLTPTYMGTTNLQQKSQIHVIKNGVDVTNSVVEWVTHW